MVLTALRPMGNPVKPLCAGERNLALAMRSLRSLLESRTRPGGTPDLLKQLSAEALLPRQEGTAHSGTLLMAEQSVVPLAQVPIQIEWQFLHFVRSRK